MFKLILVLIVGLAIGGAAGFWSGSNYGQSVAQGILQQKTVTWEKDISACREEKLKAETALADTESQLKIAQDDLKLNESREGFLTSAMLPAPEFESSDATPLVSNSKGEVLLKWLPVKGAKMYQVIVEDKDGKQVHASDVEGETYLYINIAVKSREGADYFARISSVNGLDQASPLSEPKALHFNPQKVVSRKIASKPMKKKSKKK